MLVRSTDYELFHVIRLRLTLSRYANFLAYMTQWKSLTTSPTSVDSANRPLPVAIFRGNVSVQGSWIDPLDLQADSQDSNRIVTKVAMGMPHTGVLDALTIKNNGLPQLDDFDVGRPR